jgi:CRISPR-associated protein Cmr4
VLFEGNRFISIKCAGQDDAPNVDRDSEENTGHCGHCIVCKGFGFSKRNISWQGMLYFSDLKILFFPVFTIKGTKWITTKEIIESVNLENNQTNESNASSETSDEKLCLVFEKLEESELKGYINLGWLYLPYRFSEDNNLKNKLLNIIEKCQLPFTLSLKDIILVPESLFPHIVNSNLEVRTSVSIDPITGAAKEGALFTSEAIPRGTIFYGTIRVFDKKAFGELENKLKPLPSLKDLICALEDSKHYYETLGIGGMTTRGFGRLTIKLNHGINCDNERKQGEST